MEIGNMLFGNSRGKYPISDREGFGEILSELFIKLNLDSYGNYLGDNPNFIKTLEYLNGDDEMSKLTYFDNGLVSILPYVWEFDLDVCKLPNMVIHHAQIEISWYKYPLRDSYINVELSKREFRAIIKDILEKGAN